MIRWYLYAMLEEYVLSLFTFTCPSDSKYKKKKKKKKKQVTTFFNLHRSVSSYSGKICLCYAKLDLLDYFRP